MPRIIQESIEDFPMFTENVWIVAMSEISADICTKYPIVDLLRTQVTKVCIQGCRSQVWFTGYSLASCRTGKEQQSPLDRPYDDKFYVYSTRRAGSRRDELGAGLGVGLELGWGLLEAARGWGCVQNTVVYQSKSWSRSFRGAFGSLTCTLTDSHA